MPDNIKKIQSIELDMFKVFHDLCIKHSLVYYAVGGTLLGAVRHGGFIPWDDDMDLAMPREDYEKFVQISKDILPKHLSLFPNPMNLNILQLVDNRIRIKIGKIESNVFIDIFPLDGYPNGRILSYFHDKKILFLRMLCKLSMIDILEERDRGAVENLIYKLTKLTGFSALLDENKLLQKLHSTVIKYPFNSSDKVGNVLGRYRSKEIVDKLIFGKPTLIPFEDCDMFSPERKESYLSCIYGDFMTLPPVDKRVSHNIAIISENISDE